MKKQITIIFLSMLILTIISINLVFPQGFNNNIQNQGVYNQYTDPRYQNAYSNQGNYPGQVNNGYIQPGVRYDQYGRPINGNQQTTNFGNQAQNFDRYGNRIPTSGRTYLGGSVGDSRGIQYTDPRYDTGYNQGYQGYNQFGQSTYTQSYGGYGASGLFGYGNQGGGFGFNQQLCQQGQNFLITIPPGGCSPALVRSDLLEEQNVPVFCRLTSLQTNPLLSGIRIRGVRVSGELPAGISGVSYYPARSAIQRQGQFRGGLSGFSSFGGGNQQYGQFGNNYNQYSQYNTGYSNYGNNNYGNTNYNSQNPGSFGSGSYSNQNQYFSGGYAGNYGYQGSSPITDSMGYIVVVLTQAANESALPDFVEGNITATIDYDASAGFGNGRTTFYLDQMTNDQWLRDYKKSSFFNGKAYVRADLIEQGVATISIYRDQNSIEQTITLREGQISQPLQLGGNYCSAGMSIRLDQLRAPVESALIQVNGEQMWVANGDRIINGRCRVTNVITNGQGGRVSLSCPGSNFDLELNGGRVKLNVVGRGEVDVAINQNIKDDLYLGYLGKDKNGNDLAVVVDDKISQGTIAFGDKDVFSAVELVKDKTIDQPIIDAVVARYQIKVPISDAPTVYVIRDNTPNNNNIGIGLANLLTIQDQQDFKQSPLARTYYDRAITNYRELADLYPNEKLAEGEPALAARGLSEAFSLSQKFEMSGQANEFSNQLINNYEDSYLADGARTDREQLFKYDRTNARKTIRVDNIQFSIDLLELKKPSKADASGLFIIDGREVSLAIGDFNSAQNTRIQLIGLDDDRAIIGYEYDSDGNKRTGRETLLFGDRSQTNINGVNIRLTNVNLNKQAKITILPSQLGSGSQNQVSFKVRIGIEKRAIKLSPEKTKDLIENLEKAIAEWNAINKKLGTVIKGLKAACFATSAILTIKNLFEGTTGASVARNRLMKASGGWNDKCEDLVNDGRYVSLQQCLLENNDQIEKDISIFSEQIQSTNGQLKDIQKQVGVTHDSPFDFQGQTDAKEVEKLFKEKFDGFCNGNQNTVNLPGAGSKSVSYSEICDWKGMTHEQRREILTLTNIKNSGGSEVLNNYADRELGRHVLDARNTHESRIAAITSAENTKKFLIDQRSINPIGDTVTHGQIKTLTASDIRKGGAYDRFTPKDNVVRIYIPNKKTIDGKETFDGGEVGGKEVLVKVSEIEGSGGVFSPDTNAKVVGIDGTVYGVDSNEAKAVKDYMSLSGLNKIRHNNAKAFQNQMVDVKNLRVKYFDRAPFKGLPSIVPFDVKEGWYVKTSYVLSGFGVPYDQSGRAANYYICNVGANGLIEFKKSSDDICRYYNGFNTDLSFPGMTQAQSISLVQRAQAALQDAGRQYGQENVNINGQSFESGVSFDETDGKCTDFMSAQDCNILFNVCDPVICPPSRCDLGGKYRVDNVIQTGIVGSLALCLPNFQEGIAVPICLSGVHAGLDGYISILNSTVACLNESLETGRNIGICDEIKSVYLCDFFWRQAAPFLEVLLQKTFEIAAGQGARGGGEYLTVQNAWQNTQNAIGYFTGQYAGGSIRAFQTRNLGDVQPIGSFGTGAYGGVRNQGGTPGYSGGYQSQFGTQGYNQGQFGGQQQQFSGGIGGSSGGGYAGDVGANFCKAFISSGFSGATTDIFKSLIEPDSPEQYTAWFSEFPQSTATLPPTSHYKVYYHIFAGKDIGASYQVYLKGAPQIQGIFSNNFRIVDQGYIARGSEVDQAKDFTATSGFQQLCININGREECGFGQVSTSYALNRVTDAYAEEQASQSNIVSESTCIAGTPSLYSLAQPNIQAGVEDVLNPQLYNKGIIRICASQNPGKQVLPTGQYDPTNSISDKWKEVGYCDDPTIKCWLDTESVRDIIVNTGIEDRVLANADISRLINQEGILFPDQSENALTDANRFIFNKLPKIINQNDNQQSIDQKTNDVNQKLQTVTVSGSTNLFRAKALFLLANLNRVIAEILFIPDPVDPGTPNGQQNIADPVTSPQVPPTAQVSIPGDDQLITSIPIRVKNSNEEITFFYSGSNWIAPKKPNFDTSQGYAIGIRTIINNYAEPGQKIIIDPSGKNIGRKEITINENTLREVYATLTIKKPFDDSGLSPGARDAPLSDGIFQGGAS